MEKNVPEKCYDTAAIKDFFAKVPSYEEMPEMPVEELRKLAIEAVMHLPPEERKGILAPYAQKYGIDL